MYAVLEFIVATVLMLLVAPIVTIMFCFVAAVPIAVMKLLVDVLVWAMNCATNIYDELKKPE